MLMTGKDYVAKTTIWNKEGEIVADIGQTCERVAPESLGWLLAGGHIGAVEPKTPAPAPVAASTPSVPTPAVKVDPLVTREPKTGGDE